MSAATNTAKENPKKSDLVDRVLELQRSIREKEDKLAQEQALRSEFQSLLAQSEKNE